MISKVLLLAVLTVTTLEFVATGPVTLATEEDARINEFLLGELEQGYPTWLTQHDPTPVIKETFPIEVYPCLRCDNDGVDGQLTISNFSMSGHSSDRWTEYSVISNLEHEDGKAFLAGDSHFYYEEPVVFSGDYVVNGTVTQESGSNATFTYQGQGRFRLEANTITQSVMIRNYTVTEDDHINLDWSLNNLYYYVLVVHWNNTGGDMFEGLTISDGNAQEPHLLSEIRPTADSPKLRINKALAGIFVDFMKTKFERPMETQPIKHLMVEYLKQVFVAPKFSDIISGRAQK